MDPKDILILLQLSIDLVAGQLAPAESGSLNQKILTLEGMAAAIGRAYRQEAGRPINPDLFTYEPPLGG